MAFEAPRFGGRALEKDNALAAAGMRHAAVTERPAPRDVSADAAYDGAPKLATTVRIMNDITYGMLMVPVVAGAIRALMTAASSA